MDETVLNQGIEGGNLIKIERPVFYQHQFEDNFHRQYPPDRPSGFSNQLKSLIGRTCTPDVASFKQFFINLLPILDWLPSYSLKNDLLCDIMSGCTVAVMHIPQGMGYALLGSVAPIVGIYMAFFPVLVYVILGTSHHISLGTFAVTTLMTGRIVDQYGTPLVTNISDKAVNENEAHLSNLEVATAVCLMVGLWQILMGVLHLGVVGIILSDHLVSGFTTGAAVHVLTSQIKNLIGIPVPRFSGSFRLILTYKAIFGALPSANYVEVIISAITIVIMALHNDYLKPWISKRVKFPIPAELFILVLGTVTSYYGNMNELYHIRILDDIPTGLPSPRVPPYHLLVTIAFDCLTVAVVAYAVSLSMAKIFARKRGYKICNNQELLAQGASNVVGSFFSCMPVAASLSRSLLQEAVGGQTQIASVVSCALLLMVLLWIGPFFESLPLSVLASVIVVALKGMFMQVKDLKTALKSSPLDALVWMLTFLAVVIIDIDVGLGVGVVASITVLIYRGHQPHSSVLGHLPGTEFYADINQYPTAVEVAGIKIFRWVGAIHFANGEAFRHVVDEHLRPMKTSPMSTSSSSPSVGPFDVNRSNSKINWEVKDVDSCPKYGACSDIQCDEPLTSGQTDNCCSSSAYCSSMDVPIEYFICDCSAIAFVDLTGSKVLTTLNQDLKDRRHIQLILVACSSPLIEQLERSQFFLDFSKDKWLFPSIIDAVTTIEASKLGTSAVERHGSMA